MRIISGKLKGRDFESPSGNLTHPMSERLRNALFNTLGDIEDMVVFDAYGGTGALAFESISRGAQSAFVTDNDKKAAATILSNIKKLGLESDIKFSQANAVSWLKTTGQMFDLIFADPPYSKLNEEHLKLFAQHLNVNGIMILSSSGRADTPRVDGVVVVKHRTYSNAALTFYRRED